MISDVHLTGTTHCPERVFTTHNSTPHERKISTQNLTAKGTRNMIDNILGDIETLRYMLIPACATCTCANMVARSHISLSMHGLFQ